MKVSNGGNICLWYDQIVKIRVSHQDPYWHLPRILEAGIFWVRSLILMQKYIMKTSIRSRTPDIDSEELVRLARQKGWPKGHAI